MVACIVRVIVWVIGLLSVYKYLGYCLGYCLSRNVSKHDFSWLKGLLCRIYPIEWRIMKNGPPTLLRCVCAHTIYGKRLGYNELDNHLIMSNCLLSHASKMW